MAERPPRLAILAAFAVVYFVWGSTYLAIRVAVQDIPPGLLAGVRFVVAGLILGLAALLRGDRLPRGFTEWRAVLIMATALVVIGNGFVTWAEQWVPSNQTALIIAGSALWTAWFGTFGPRGTPLTMGACIGLATGILGVALLVWPDDLNDRPVVWALVAIFLSSVSWSAGVIFGRNARLSLSPLMFAAAQMFFGGIMLTVAGLAAGEPEQISWTASGIGGFLYLTIFGSCLAYGTYIWLINHATPARLGTIAYVNPVIATVLGWWLLDESLGTRQIAGMIVILLGVVLVARYGKA